MSWTQRFASFCLAALFICGGAQAQPDIGNGNNGNHGNGNNGNGNGQN